MIQLTPQMRVYVATQPADFRKGIDGIAQLCRGELGEDPLGGAAFVFRNRRRTAVKILVYDGQGFWLCHKRLSSGKFRHWPSSEDASVRRVEALELMVLLGGGDPYGADAAPMWRRVDGFAQTSSVKEHRMSG